MKDQTIQFRGDEQFIHCCNVCQHLTSHPVKRDRPCAVSNCDGRSNPISKHGFEYLMVGNGNTLFVQECQDELGL